MLTVHDPSDIQRLLSKAQLVVENLTTAKNEMLGKGPRELELNSEKSEGFLDHLVLWSGKVARKPKIERSVLEKRSEIASTPRPRKNRKQEK